MAGGGVQRTNHTPVKLDIAGSREDNIETT